MTPAILRRLASMLITLVGVLVVVFVIVRLLPGNAVTASLGVNVGLLTKAQLHAIDQFYGIGQSIPQQFLSWLWAMLHGNLGVSLSSREPVATLIGSALPVTLELAVMSMILGILLGVSFGVLGGLHPDRWQDDVGQGLSVFGLAVPSFVIGTILITYLSSWFHYFPSSLGFVGLFTNPWLNLQQVFLPALTLSFGIGAAIMRTTRAAMLEASHLNFARTAEGKGVSRLVFIWRHLFLNSLIAVTTMSGIQFGYLLGGAVIVEDIFVLPGLGRLLITSVTDRDFPVVQTIVLIFAVGFIVLNTLIDVSYTLIDPRTRQR